MLASTTVVLLVLNLFVTFAAFLVCSLLELLLPGILPNSFKVLISSIINKYLEWKHPIYGENGDTVRIPSCPYVWPNGQGDIAKFLKGVENSAAWEKQHGRIYRIWSGMKPEIVLTQPHHLQTVFRDSDKHSKAPANNSGFYMNRLLGECVGLLSGTDWRSVRAVAEPPFQRAAVCSQAERIQRCVADYFEQLHAKDDGGLKNHLLHPVDDLAMLPFRVIADMFYGPLPPQLKRQLDDLIPLRTHIFNQHIIKGGLHRFSWARFLPTSANQELIRFKKAWKRFNQKVLAHAQQNAHTRQPVVSMYEAVASGNISEEQLLQTLDESLFANLDVTMGGLSWVPVFLAAHQNAQSRLRAEIETEASNSDMLHRYLVNGRSTYLACCVIESSRLRPLAAFSVPQAAPTPRRLEVSPGLSYVVPEGTSFVVDTYALNVRNEAWAPDNESFRPERFLNSSQKDARDRRYLFWRYGFGPRQCMGRHAADLIIRTTVAHLVRNYQLDLLSPEDHLDGSSSSRNQECWITHPSLHLRCTRRMLENK